MQMSGEYILTTERMRRVTRNERGRVVKRETFVRGDVVPFDEEDQDLRLEELLADGAVVSRDEWESRQAGGPPAYTQGQGAPTADRADPTANGYQGPQPEGGLPPDSDEGLDEPEDEDQV